MWLPPPRVEFLLSLVGTIQSPKGCPHWLSLGHMPVPWLQATQGEPTFGVQSFRIGSRTLAHSTLPDTILSLTLAISKAKKVKFGTESTKAGFSPNCCLWNSHAVCAERLLQRGWVGKSGTWKSGWPSAPGTVAHRERQQEKSYAPIEVTVYTQEGKEITCRTYQMRNYESAPPSPQYKKVICMGAKENGLPLEYREKLDAIEPNGYRGRVSDDVEDIVRKGETKLIST